MQTMKNLFRIVLGFSAVCLTWGLHLDSALAENSSPTLEIQVQSEGLAIIEAVVPLPAPREVVFEVLTDYLNWTTLFPEGVHIQIRDCPGLCTVTDMIIPNSFIPWETHLVTQSKEYPPQKLEMSLIDGDYLQYAQAWELVPVQEEQKTHGKFTLTLQPKGWVTSWLPDSLYAWILEKELQEHFQRLRDQVVLRQSGAAADQ